MNYDKYEQPYIPTVQEQAEYEAMLMDQHTCDCGDYKEAIEPMCDECFNRELARWLNN